MANVIINDTHLNNIASAIREKNGTTTKYKPSEMPTAISAIETGSGSSEWQPQPDWWDIDSILENDTEDYPGKIIALFRDDDDTSTINRTLKYTKCITSDGTTYMNENANITHTWDKTQDKECSIGYKTRYIIFYYENNSNFSFNGNLPSRCLYFIMKNFSNVGNAMNYNTATNLWGGNDDIQYIKCIDTAFSDISLNGLSSNLNKIEGLYCNSITNTNFSSLQHFDYNCIDVSKIVNSQNGLFRACIFKNGVFPYKDFPWDKINFQQLFEDCRVKYIDNIDFNNCATTWNVFNSGYLRSIRSVSNIKISGLSLSGNSNVTHDTLVRFLNALYDYAAEGSTDTYTLTLGTTNLAKLTDEEKAIATNKGWTLN